MKIRSIIILGVLLIGCAFWIQGVNLIVPYDTVLNRNQTSAPQDIPSPLSASPVFGLPDPNEKFSYNISEACYQYFPWSPINTTQAITIDAPSTYNATFANFSIQTMNATLNETTVVDWSSGSSQRLEQVQGFIISSDSYLNGFSLYFPTSKNSFTATIGIRNASHDASDFYTLPVSISGPGNRWVNVTLPDSLFLGVGHYYLHVPTVSPGGNLWGHTTTATINDAWVYSGTAWSLQSWDLTLKIRTRSIVNISAIELMIESQPVTDLGAGLGWINISKTYTSVPVSFNVTCNTPIAYSFMANATYFGEHRANISVDLEQLIPTWNLTIPLSNSSFSNYQGNVSGLRNDFFNIQASASGSVVGYSRLDSTTISLTAPADLITFQSPNYINNVTCPIEVYSGNIVDLNVSVRANGNASVSIYNASTPIFQDDALTSNVASFVWNVPDNSLPSTVVLQALFFGDNEIGVNLTNIFVKTDALLSASTFITTALEPTVLDCQYYESFSLLPIQSALVNYNMSGVSGQMDYQVSGHYASILNLDQFAILPGTYSISISAEKDGYRTRTRDVNMQISYREVDLQLKPSVTSLTPDQAVQFDLSLADKITGVYLSRPINITLTIYPTGGNPNTPVATYTFLGITSSGQYSWFVPAGTALGQYDINVTVVSAYFAGTLVVPQVVNILPALETWAVVLITIAIAAAAAGAYVVRQRALSKQSVRGAIIMNPGGMPIARRISADFSTMNPHLISGAVMGIVTMVKEMTGSSIRTIALEGRYLKIVLRDTFWFVLLTQRNPVWISGIVKKLIGDIELRYGKEIASWKGEAIHISLDLTLKRWFGVDIAETRDPDLEMGSGVNQAPNEGPNHSSPQPPSPPPSQ